MGTDDKAAWMFEEHTKVAELSDRLREMVASPPRGDRARWIANLRSRFDDFAMHLRRHLAMEEEGGYLTQVLELRPTLSQAVDLIEHEHQELTRIFDDVQAAVHELSPTDNLLLRDCCQRVEHLLAGIERHEEHENHLVAYAFNQDIGAQD